MRSHESDEMLSPGQIYCYFDEQVLEYYTLLFSRPVRIRGHDRMSNCWTVIITYPTDGEIEVCTMFFDEIKSLPGFRRVS